MILYVKKFPPRVFGCYFNAALYVAHFDRTARYVEGIVRRQNVEAGATVSVEHSWVVDSQGRILEVTWDDPAAVAEEWKARVAARRAAGNIVFGRANVYKDRYIAKRKKSRKQLMRMKSWQREYSEWKRLMRTKSQQREHAKWRKENDRQRIERIAE